MAEPNAAVNELPIVVEKGEQGLTLSNPPEFVLQEAQKAARALKDVISKKPNPVIFNKEQYLEFEDWQTVARFYGLTVKVASTNFIDYGTARGFESRAVVLDRMGNEISAAEAMCLNDEEKWSSRAKYQWKDGAKIKIGEEAVPLFQLRSMAQTRACAKAYRNVLAWVVVLAGYRPTPAEEMTGTEQRSTPPPQQPARTQQPQQGTTGSNGAVISEAQGKRLYAIAKQAGVSDDDLKFHLQSEYGIAHTKDIQRSDYEAVVSWAQSAGGQDAGANG